MRKKSKLTKNRQRRERRQIREKFRQDWKICQNRKIAEMMKKLERRFKGNAAFPTKIRKFTGDDQLTKMKRKKKNIFDRKFNRWQNFRFFFRKIKLEIPINIEFSKM